MSTLSNRKGARFSFAIAIVALLALLKVPAVAGQEVSYVYDELGRLIAVADTTGETAVYTYDAVGNLLSIARIPPATVSIIHLSPSSGPIGTTVTIHGTGFNPDAAQNAVSFNGTSATVISATPSTLVVTVPAGASSGPVSVVNSAGSAQSPHPFSVAALAGPTVLSVDPSVGAAGTQVMVGGLWFHPIPSQDTVKFNVTTAATPSSATPTDLQVTVPSGATSGRVSVTTPGGTGIGPDFFVPPSPYTASDVVSTGRFTVDGPPLQVPIATPLKIGLAVFDAVAGQRLNLRVNPSGSSSIQVRQPNGTTFFNMSVGIVTAWSDVQVAPVTGTYTVTVDPAGSGTGTTTLTLFNVAPDYVGTIVADGTMVFVPIITPGQNALLTFEGVADQRVSLHVAGPLSGTFRIVRPNGVVLASKTLSPSFGAFIDTTVLPTTGTYSVEIDPAPGSTGGVEVRLYTVPPDLEDTIEPDGPPVTQTITVPGQNGVMTFTGTAGQRVSVSVSSGPQGSVLLVGPNGSTLASTTISLLARFIEPVTLSQSGTHSIVVDLSAEKTGSVTITLFNVADDLTGELTINGSAVPVNITTPGQNASYTFTGTSAQAVTVNVTGNTIGSTTVRLLNPSGGQITSRTSSAASFNLTQQTLSVTGTFTVVVDPGQAATGTLNLSVTSP